MRTTILTHRKTSLALGLMLLASMTVVRHGGFGANAAQLSRTIAEKMNSAFDQAESQGFIHVRPLQSNKVSSPLLNGAYFPPDAPGAIFAPGDTTFGGRRNGSNFEVGVIGVTANANNWPALEAPPNAIDRTGSKYLNFAELDTGLIVTPAFGAPSGSVVTSLQIWTANDAPERDPASYELYGSNAPISGPGPFSMALFTLISSGSLSLPAGRHIGSLPLNDANSQTVTFSNTTAYKSYLLLFPTVKNASTANSMQIGEAQLFGQAACVDATITATMPACSLSTGNTASVPDAGPGATYVWSITGGSITGGQGTPNISWTAGAAGTATINVTVTNALGCSANGSKQVTVNQSPSPLITIDGPDTVCALSTGNQYGGPGGGSSYSWMISGNGTIIGPTTGQFVNVTAGAAGSFTLSLRVSNSLGCFTTLTKVVTVNPVPNVTSVNDIVVCAGATVPSVVFASNVPGASFSWSRTNEAIGLGVNSGTGNIPAFTATNTGTTPLTATFNVVASFTSNGVTCTGTPIQFRITVNPNPVVNPVSPAAICSGSQTNIVLGSTPAGATFSWTASLASGNVTGFSDGSGGTIAQTLTGSGVVKYTVAASLENCPSAPVEILQTVNLGPAITTQPVSLAVCETGNVTFTAAASGVPAPTLQWQVSINGGGSFTDIPGETSTSLTVSNVTAAMNGYQYRAVFTNTCGSATTDAATLTVNNCAANFSDPLVCTGPGNVVTGTINITNNGAVAASVAVSTTLPAGLLALPGRCAPAGCDDSNPAQVTFAGTINAGQTLTIIYQAQIGDQVVGGTTLCALTSVSFNGGPGASVQACTTLNCSPIGPGLIPEARSPVSDQKAGSVLFYNIYTSSSDQTRQNTRFSITNTNPSRPVYVHLFLVDGSSCGVADFFLCLTRNQTASFLASDLDPGTTGYMVAVATDRSGCPVNFNYLIGDAYVKFATGHAANLGAEAVSALAGGLPLCDSQSLTATLAFDGVSYNPVPRVLAADHLGSRSDGNDTLLIVNRVGGNLGTGAATLGSLFGILYDDAESAQSFSLTGGCQLRGSLSNGFPRTTPRYEEVIPAGHSGWMRIYAADEVGILGAMINYNAGAETGSGAFNQGHNLHKLTLTDRMRLTIPVFPPGCQ